MMPTISYALQCVNVRTGFLVFQKKHHFGVVSPAKPFLTFQDQQHCLFDFHLKIYQVFVPI